MLGVILESLLFALMVAAYRVMRGTELWIAAVSGITIFIVALPLLYLWNRRELKKMQKPRENQEKPGSMTIKSQTSGNHPHKGKKKKK